MKLMKSCVLVGLCLLHITACGMQDEKKERRDRDDDDKTVTIDTSEKTESGNSDAKRIDCKPLDKVCQARAQEAAMEETEQKEEEGQTSMEEQEEEPMMSSEDGEFTIYHVSQGACGEAERIFQSCEGSTEEMNLRDDWTGPLCIRENYDYAHCFINHPDEVCKMVDSDWDYGSDIFFDCVDTIYEERVCDAFRLQWLSCNGMEYHELPEEFAGEVCDDEEKVRGGCALDYPDEVCRFFAEYDEDSEEPYMPGDNGFMDCVINNQ